MRKQIRLSKRTLGLLVLGAALIPAGCAVLTVDVDMYKGPLANDETVIAEQIKAEIIGAKPLLVQLRDTLEAKGPKGDKTTHPAIWRKQKNAKCWYKPSYIGPAPGQTKSRFENQNADRVNDVLSLYEDLEDEQYSLFVRRANQALKDYSVAYAILKPDRREADEKVWKDIGLKKDGFQREVDLLVKGKPNTNIERELSKAIEELRNKYENFYKGIDPNSKALLKSWCKIRNQLKKLEIKLPDFTLLQNDHMFKVSDEEFEVSSNAAFRALDRTSLVDFQAEHLFGLKDKKGELFVNHVKKISRAFLEARAALDRLLQVELETIIWLSEQDEKVVPRYDQRILETSRAVLEIVQSRHVVALVKLLDENDPGVPDGLVPLSEALKSTKDWRERWYPADYENAKEKLLSELIKHPGKTAKRLLDGHKYYRIEKGTLDSKLEKTRLNSIRYEQDYHTWYISGYKYGFAKGPYAKVSTIPSLRGLVRKAFPTGVFCKGRLDKGLQTLIEEYLELSSDCNTDEDKVECARKRLSDALVRFAEKVLVIANYGTLLHDEDGKGKSDGSNEMRKYTDVLQAVGNSIIVLANELEMRASHEVKLVQGRHREVKALEKAFSGDVPENISRDSDTSKDVLDDTISMLQMEYAKAVKEKGKNNSKNIAEALDVLYKQRANMVYIRPASAYLRSSYPAASLQRDPSSAGWENMLGRHAWRSVPFFGEWGEKDRIPDLKTLREIDKQSWQNVNHIRVAGAGNTNYVIVKDDIGNWYIKGYGSDPKPIIEGARNMALFAASAQAGQNLIESYRQREEALKQGRPLPESPQIKKLRDYDARYQQRLERDYEELKKAVDGLRSRIESQWSAHNEIDEVESKDMSKSLLSSPTTELKQRKDEVSRMKDAKVMEKYTETLSAVVEYHNDISSEIVSELESEGKNSAEKKSLTTARRLMSNTLHDILNRFIERREIASRDHEKVLMVIGDAVGE